MVINDVATENVRIVCNSCNGTHRPKEIKLVEAKEEMRLEVVQEKCQSCKNVKIVTDGHLGFVSVNPEYSFKNKQVNWYAYFTYEEDIRLRNQTNYALQVLKSHYGGSFIEVCDPPCLEESILSKNTGMSRVRIGKFMDDK